MNGRTLRLRDIAQVRRGTVDPPQPIFRVNGKDAIGLAIAMRDGGDILTLGRNLDAAMRKITANLPIGIETTLVANQAVVVDDAIREFLESLWQAIAIIMVVSFIALGVRPGTVVALSIPLTIGLTFPVMELVHIDLQRISLGALIIALSLLVDDAMTTIDVMESRLAEGDEKESAATYAYRTLAAAMLTGSFITATGFVPIGFARSSAGEYTFSIFVVVGLTLMLSWLVAVLFAPLLGVWMLKKPEGKVIHRARPAHARLPGASWWRPCGRDGSPSASRWRRSSAPSWRARSSRGSSSRRPTGRSCWSTSASRRTRRSTPPARPRTGSTPC